MSIKIMGLVWGSELEGAGPRFVLLAIADNADDDGYCWPAWATIARKTGLKRATIHRLVAGLAEQGFIEIVNRQRPDGGQQSNAYRIDTEKLKAMQAPTRVDRSPVADLFPDKPL